MTHALRDSESISNDRVAQNREIIIDFPSRSRKSSRSSTPSCVFFFCTHFCVECQKPVVNKNMALEKSYYKSISKSRFHFIKSSPPGTNYQIILNCNSCIFIINK